MIKEELLPQIKPGARVKVYEGTNTPFEGLVLSRKHGKESGATFTVRSVVAGIGVEKIFPLQCPAVSRLEIVSSPKKVHRSKLYFVKTMPGHRVRKKLGVSV